MKRLALVGTLLLLAALLFVADQAARTLRTLDAVERERDRWQRPDEIIQYLDLRSGAVVVDLGSGAGYFALKLALRVGPSGRVVAVDLRRQSLAFLWFRAVRARHSNLQVVLGRVDDPRLPPGAVDAALVANTYHELTNSASVLSALFRSMRSGSRLVVVDRGIRESREPHTNAGHHQIPVDEAEDDIAAIGFAGVTRIDRFIDRPEDDPWWLLVFRKP